MNNAAILVTGHSSGRYPIGTDYLKSLHRSGEGASGIPTVFREGQVQDYGLEIRHRDGHITPVLYNASVYRDNDGEIVGVFAAARDITSASNMKNKFSSSMRNWKSELPTAPPNSQPQTKSWSRSPMRSLMTCARPCGTFKGFPAFCLPRLALNSTKPPTGIWSVFKTL